MDNIQEQKKGDTVEEDGKGKNKLQTRNQTFSAYSSPTHDFSFKVSFQQTKSSPCISTVDLSPADEIFFHGHLLPLRLLSHLPRSSAHSQEIETFTLPIKEENRNKTSITTSPKFQRREKVKSKSFFFLGKRRKLSFNMSHVIRRYIRVLKPLLFIKGKKENVELERKPHSFSGYFSPRKKREARERGGVASAPVSRWTSPRNSGKLAANKSVSSTKSDSSMEELQDAIQAAIAHCKNSIGKDEKSRS